MPSCPNCRANVPAGDSHCDACGTAIAEERAAFTQNDVAIAEGNVDSAEEGSAEEDSTEDGSTSSEDGPDPMIERVIGGEFAIEDFLGEGSMGRVYAARRQTDGEHVAIKVMHRHLALDPRVAKRFHREARTASRLSHPNSLHIVDFGEDDDGTLFIAMELLHGDDLLSLIENDHPLSPARILEIMTQVLDALQAAHDAGIIHRDLKPENILVDRGADGRLHVKVCDFGIAKIQETEGGSALTVSGFVCGTPEYMAPEQARGEELDPRADVYAAGCMLYQLLTGQMPFKAETALGTITKHLTEPPVSPSRQAPHLEIPKAVERVCLKAMRKDRDDRFSDARSMEQALQQAVNSLGDQAHEPLRHRRAVEIQPLAGESPSSASVPALRLRRVSLWVAAGAAAVVVVGLVGVLLVPTSEGRNVHARNRPASTETAPPATAAGSPPATSDDASNADAEAGDEPPRVAAPSPSAAVDASADPATDAGGPTAADRTSPDSSGKRATEDPPEARRAARHEVARNEADEDNAEEKKAAPSDSRARDKAAPPTSPDWGDTRESDASAGTPTETPRAPPKRHARADEDENKGEDTQGTAGRRAFEEGRRLFLANDIEAAIRRFRKAARLMPRNPKVHKQLARAYMRSGEVSEGVSAYRRYLELAPQAPDRAVIEQIVRQRGGG